MLPIPHPSYKKLRHFDSLLPGKMQPGLLTGKAPGNRMYHHAHRNVRPAEAIAAIAFSLFKLNGWRIGKKQADAVSGNYYFGLEDSNIIDKAVSAFYELKQEKAVLRNGDTHKNMVAEHRSDLFKAGDVDVIAFSKTLNDEEALIIYNTLPGDAAEKFILLNDNITRPAKKLTSIYGHEACSHVCVMQGMLNSIKISYINLYLKPNHLVILTTPACCSL